MSRKLTAASIAALNDQNVRLKAYMDAADGQKADSRAVLNLLSEMAESQRLVLETLQLVAEIQAEDADRP